MIAALGTVHPATTPLPDNLDTDIKPHEASHSSKKAINGNIPSPATNTEPRANSKSDPQFNEHCEYTNETSITETKAVDHPAVCENGVNTHTASELAPNTPPKPDQSPKTQDLTSLPAVNGDIYDLPSSEPPSSPSRAMTKEVDNSTARRSGRKRTAAKAPIETLEYVEYLPATAEEKRDWKGFCEIESEPFIFNALLQRFGTQHLEIREVYVVDPEQVKAFGAIYGFVFLFQVSDEEQEDELDSAGSEGVWFANQISGNACATIALINILMNARCRDGLDQLGEDLRGFRSSTQGMTPADRGNAIAQSVVIRQAHNSFARRIDMMDADLALDNEAEEWEEKKQKKTARKTKAKPKAKGKRKTVDSDQVYHFVAYVPDENGDIWMLDGMNTAPHRVGQYTPGASGAGSEWWHTLLPLINERMMRLAGGGIAFNLLALCEDQLLEPKIQVAVQQHMILQLEERLDAEVSKDPQLPYTHWKRYHPGALGAYAGTSTSKPELKEHDWTPSFIVHPPTTDYGLTEAIWELGKSLANQQLHHAAPSSQSAEDMISARIAAYKSQEAHIRTIIDVQGARQGDEQLAAEKMGDFGPAVHAWLEMLIQNGALREILEEKG